MKLTARYTLHILASQMLPSTSSSIMPGLPGKERTCAVQCHKSKKLTFNVSTILATSSHVHWAMLTWTCQTCRVVLPGSRSDGSLKAAKQRWPWRHAAASCIKPMSRLMVSPGAGRLALAWHHLSATHHCTSCWNGSCTAPSHILHRMVCLQSESHCSGQ